MAAKKALVVRWMAEVVGNQAVGVMLVGKQVLAEMVVLVGNLVLEN